MHPASPASPFTKTAFCLSLYELTASIFVVGMKYCIVLYCIVFKLCGSVFDFAIYCVQGINTLEVQCRDVVGIHHKITEFRALKFVQFFLVYFFWCLHLWLFL